MARDDPLDAPATRAFSRRAFVKGCLMASAAGVAAAGGQALVSPVSVAAGDARRVDYLGATVLGGPAPQGLPLLPLAVGADGALSGDAAPEGVEGGVLDWYRYCGHAKDRPLQPSWSGDESLRYFVTPQKQDQVAQLRALGAPDAGWYLDRLGEVANVADFAAPGRGANLMWRGSVPAIALRADPAALTFGEGVDERLVRERFLAPAPDGGAVVAYVGFCKHFCCVPGWHESPKAFTTERFETLFCTCHDSVYDPLAIRGDFFVLRA